MGAHIYNPILIAVLAASLQFPLGAQQANASLDVPPAAVNTPSDPPAADDTPDRLPKTAPLVPSLLNPVLPVKPAPPRVVSLEPKSPAETGVRWGSLFKASARFLTIEHSFRLATEPGTREGLKGSYLRNYASSVANLHGWADGDEFYVNYVGHPMQGAVAGFLWTQNDPAFHKAVFGKDPLYWKSRLRAAAFVWVYSTQFEIGPISEASIGAIQAQFPQQGFVDHVVTPSLGLAWIIGEDVVDRYITEPIEARVENHYIRLFVRMGSNPARTFSNVLNGHAPWTRDSRAGVKSYARMDREFVTAMSPKSKPARAETTDPSLAPPFEFNLTFQPERFWGSGNSTHCLGGAGGAAFRLASSWQLATEVGGCKMIGLEKNLSGDSLTYAAGPRWIGRIRGGWTAQWQVLLGGNKVSEERMYPEKKKLLEAIAIRTDKLPPVHADYTDATETHGFSVSTGGGVSYQVNNAITIKVADISYRHNWTDTLWGRDYSNSLKFTSGFVLHMGTW